ncbi:HD domain-containing protein [Terrabacter sp. MAHUQ-38]|uniref:HD domain-containing protein n=1 Tax=unclassified Terrabacter TaxID=2630222 RepID=UPI00165D7931|nr:HD domain-containing protein [Terrabacter sp. MAHUQ-38]MBC9822556.1 HD domain-containing protein [Terrabacter sp. MAHUQ-38]
MGLMRTQTAPNLAADRLGRRGRRWRHVQRVGRLAESLDVRGLVSAEVLAAAWLHDVGYGPSVARTGFHPLDGARFLQEQGVSAEVVALVAHHTGARFEAEERGLLDELETLPSPPPEDLDALTLIDLVVGPTGELTTPGRRIEEILTRYGSGDPVHRAVTRSRSSLLDSAARARSRLGLSDEWPLAPGQGVLKA